MSRLYSAAVAAGMMVVIGWLTGSVVIALIAGGVAFALARGGKI